jgi:hypothetical protein
LLPLLVFAATIGSVAIGQTIVKVPEKEAPSVARPDDLFNLPPDQWHFAKSLWDEGAPCTPTQCEAGFTADGLVISVEHAGEFVRIIAGVRDCEAVAFSEVAVGKKPGKPTFGRVRKQAERVVKGLSKTCNRAIPDVPALDVAQLFPRSGGSTS